MRRSQATRRAPPAETKNPDPPAKQLRAGDETQVVPRGTMERATLAREHPGLVVIQGREIGREYRLRRSELVLGRDEGAHLRIPDDLVSRRHALLELSWDLARRLQRVTVRDLGSTNGTHVNGEQVDQADLREGDKLRVGDTVLKFVLQDDLDARFHQEIRNRIAHDQLTGLLTKESLYLAMESELRRCERFHLPMAVLMMDLDRFKSVNDGHGHLMGSHVLAEVGRLICQGIRSTDVSARYGGEEFLAYLSDVTAEGGASAAERIREAVAAHSFTRVDESGNSKTLRITISLGVSEFPRNGRTLEALVAAADAALYRAKETGRNRICLA